MLCKIFKRTIKNSRKDRRVYDKWIIWQIIEHEGIRVLTTQQLAESYGTDTNLFHTF